MFIRFLLVGGAGFIVDTGLTYCLVLLNIEPWLARIPSMACAISFTWLTNRHFTYRLKTDHDASEVMRYFTVALIMGGINYAIYLFLINIEFHPVIAILIATAFQTVFSFFAYRRFAFKLPS